MPYIIRKLSTRTTTLLQTSPQSKVYTKRYGPPKSQESQLGNFQIPNLGVLGQNDIWVTAPWPCTMNIIRGRWWFPSNMGHGESCEFVFNCGSSMHQKCSHYALTNLLFSLCRSMWIINPLVTRHSSHPRAPTRPLPFEVLRARNVSQFFVLSLFSPLDSKLSLSRSLRVHQLLCSTPNH